VALQRLASLRRLVEAGKQSLDRRHGVTTVGRTFVALECFRADVTQFGECLLRETPRLAGAFQSMRKGVDHFQINGLVVAHPLNSPASSGVSL
jgi:hypothetical protein